MGGRGGEEGRLSLRWDGDGWTQDDLGGGFGWSWVVEVERRKRNWGEELFRIFLKDANGGRVGSLAEKQFRFN